ncbi:unnamed protein product [Arctia plantaginis]|uniref:NACHT domain-containing protein n=1 Tax=Arctia plantaginis TaxID=874455 RepID=A0A8S0ZML8_ARCPL|nr:unnamed protein product [Arctia plantaginis]
MYKKRAIGHSIHGQLYETKLLSLILFRAQHNNDIEEFYMGSNIENAHHFDDICFKAKIKGHDRPLVVFLQVKHKANDRIPIPNPINIVKFFNSYLAIKRCFSTKSEDIFFNEYFDNTECLCIFYTNAKCDFKRDDLNNPFANHLTQLIGTSMVGGSQLCHTDEDIQLLETELLKHEMKILAKNFAKYISTKRNEMMMNDEYILRYHIILARNVLHVSKERKEYSVCTFRHDFFETSDKYLSLFKEEFFQNIFESLQSKHNPTQTSHVDEFLSYPSERTLMNVIGSHITYKNNELKFINNVPYDLKKQLSLINLPHSTINKAINTVTIKKLQSLTFKVPFIFGNTDLVLPGSTKKVERRIDFLAASIEDLIKKSKPHCIVSIDDTIAVGLLRLNGGLAGAVGNLLVYDDESGLLKFTDDCSLLEPNAKCLLIKIREKIGDLKNYRIQVNTEKFPKLTVHDHYHKHLVKKFLSKLVLWTEQASHEVIEKILIEEIENHESYSKTDYFRIKSDAIFVKYHDNIQKWWMLPVQHYLTKERNMYQLAVENISKNQLIHITSTMYMKKIASAEYSLNEEALHCFSDFFSKTKQTIVVTNITILTVIKVIQCLSKMKVYDPIVLDLKYVFEMLTDEFYALISELKKKDLKEILILICDDLSTIPNSNIKLQKFIQEISDKEVVIIINNTDASMMRQWFPQIPKVISDKNHSMEDLGATSQLKILNNAKVSFQGENVTLADLVDGLPMKFIVGSVLRKVILNENIVVGGSLTDSSYDKIQHLFVDRKVIRDHVPLELRTLADVKDDIVIVTGKPGIGKSTLLTHLAVKTKKVKYKLWIVKINFLDCVKHFNKWQKHGTVVGTLEMLKLMCHVVLQSIRPGFDAKISLHIESNGYVNLLDLGVDDEWTTFELRLFLHSYMKKNVIFLFDGFDEICPHYTDTVMAFLKIIKDDSRKNKMWITSRSYKDIDTLIRLGKPYELEGFDENELHVFLDKFWQTNLLLSNFDKEHIEKLKEFLDKTALHLAEHSTTILNYPLGSIFVSLILYLITNFPDLDGRDKWRDLYETIPHSWKHISVYEGESGVSSINHCVVKTPLLAYLSAKHFSDHIKHLEDKTYTLYYKTCITDIYEQFVKTKLLHHFLNNKKVDIYNPSIRMEYEEELQKLMKVYTNS